MSAAGPSPDIFEVWEAMAKHTQKAIQILEGADKPRVPLSGPVVEQVDTPASRPDGAGDAQAYAGSNPAGATSRKLIRNAVRCRQCGGEAESTSRHDYRTCSCGGVSADGGLDYLKRGWTALGKFEATNPWDYFDELATYSDGTGPIPGVDIPSGWPGNAPKAPSESVTRECEGCGAHKPLEEMATVLLPGTGETFQCIACRGGP